MPRQSLSQTTDCCCSLPLGTLRTSLHDSFLVPRGPFGIRSRRTELEPGKRALPSGCAPPTRQDGTLKQTTGCCCSSLLGIQPTSVHGSFPVQHGLSDRHSRLTGRARGTIAQALSKTKTQMSGRRSRLHLRCYRSYCHRRYCWMRGTWPTSARPSTLGRRGPTGRRSTCSWSGCLA